MITVLWGVFLRSRLDWCLLATPRWAGDMFQEQLLGEPPIPAHFRSRRDFASSQRSWLVSGTIAMCFLRPPTPGLDREDFVTTTSPQIRGLYAGSLISVNAVGGGIGEYYAKNTGLNYIGANAGASLDMSKFLEQWWRGSTWQVTESYINSAQPQSFLTGDVSGASGNPFARGYQVGRARYQTQQCVHKPISSSESDCGLDRQLFKWIHQIWEFIGSARDVVGCEFSVLYRRDCDERYASGYVQPKLYRFRI